MQFISNKSRSDSSSQTSNKGWNTGSDPKDDLNLLINKANTANIMTIFKSYGINIDGYGDNKLIKLCCPLPGHNDHSPSFYYYTETYSFNCFGCHRGGRAVNLVSIMENINVAEAAAKIVSNYYVDNNVDVENKKDYFDKQKAMLDFSESVRFFIQNNSEDEEAIKYAEKITFAYDTMMNKHSLETEGLKKIIEKLIRKLEKY